MFIVIEIQTTNENQIGNLVWAYETQNEAFEKYFSILSNAAVSALPVHAAVILDNCGNQIAAQHFKHDEGEA